MKEAPLKERIKIEMEPFQLILKKILKINVRKPIIFSVPQFISNKVTLPITDDRKENQEIITVKLVEKRFDINNIHFTVL